MVVVVVCGHISGRTGKLVGSGRGRGGTTSACATTVGRGATSHCGGA